MTPLTDQSTKRTCTIAAIEGTPKTIERMVSMGLTVGTRLTVIMNSGQQPLLVYARDTAIALARKEASNILVTGQ